MSPDLGDTWHQVLPMSPQREGGLDLGSDCINEIDYEYDDENDEDSNIEELDSCAAGGARDKISEVRESPQRDPLCDRLTPYDVLVLRTTGFKWYHSKFFMVNSQNYGSPS